MNLQKSVFSLILLLPSFISPALLTAQTAASPAEQIQILLTEAAKIRADNKNTGDAAKRYAYIINQYKQGNEAVTNIDIEEACLNLFGMLHLTKTLDKNQAVIEACPAAYLDQLYGRADRPHLLIFAPKASYPKAAGEKKLSGNAKVKFNIDRTGRVNEKSVRILEASDHLFREPAIKAVKKYIYLPQLSNGETVAVKEAVVELAFKPSKSRKSKSQDQTSEAESP